LRKAEKLQRTLRETLRLTRCSTNMIWEERLRELHLFSKNKRRLSRRKGLKTDF